MKRELGTSENTCATCKAFHRAERMCSIEPQYGRCSAHTMVDCMSDGSVREETVRLAARFANDTCEVWR